MSTENILENISIAKPCSASWDDMVGSETVRLCGQCDRNVYNIASMSKKEAEALITTSEGGRLPCMRMFKRQDGTVITDDCPVGLRMVRDRMRQTGRMVAGVVSMLMSFCSAHAQTGDAKEAKNCGADGTQQTAAKSSKNRPDQLIPTMGAVRMPPPVAPIEPVKSGDAINRKSKKPLTFGEYKKSVGGVDIAKHTMTLEKFKKSVVEKNTYVLDLRDKAQYDRGHIKGALHLGADVTAEKLAQLVGKKNATVVLYCSNTIYPTRMIALTYSVLPQVIALGYPNTFMLEPVYLKEMTNSAPFIEGPLWDKITVGQPAPKP